MSHVVLIGNIKGVVTLSSGKVVDVAPEHIEADSHDEAWEIAHLVGLRRVAEGHLDHENGDPFVYEPHERFHHYKPHAANHTIHEMLKNKGVN